MRARATFKKPGRKLPGFFSLVLSPLCFLAYLCDVAKCVLSPCALQCSAAVPQDNLQRVTGFL